MKISGNPRQTHLLTFLQVVASLTVFTATGWAAEIQISPSSSKINTPMTFTVTNCSNCFDLFWEFKKIDDASVVDGGEGYTVVKRFPVAGVYRVMVTGQQILSGGYAVYVSRSKEFTVTAAPFSITITPNPNWTVSGSKSLSNTTNGIECVSKDALHPDIPKDASLCTETYLPGESLHLKVILQDDAEFLGWEVNDEIVTDEQYLKMLTPKE